MNINSKFNVGDSVLVSGSPVKITSIIVNVTEDKKLIRYSVIDGHKTRVVNEENIGKQ